MKTCTKCKMEKSLDDYHADKTRLADGKHPYCKECKRLKDSEYRTSHIQKRREVDNVYSENNRDKCAARAKAWYKENTDKAKTSRCEWYHNNKAHVVITRTAWYEENADKMKDYHNSYNKQRYAENIQYRVKSVINARLRSCVRNRTMKTLAYLGCSIPLFIKWIEYQFDQTMNWENMGTYWQMDHVKPCASFNFENESEIYECYNWSNIRPLSGRENSSKGCKICHDIILQQQERALRFKQINPLDVPS